MAGSVGERSSSSKMSAEDELDDMMGERVDESASLGSNGDEDEGDRSRGCRAKR